MAERLWVAAGGGGDALAALLVRGAREHEGGPPLVASFSWDRFIFDPEPGPRAPADFSALRRVTAHGWEVTADSQLLRGGRSTLALLATHTGARFFLLDPRGGAVGIRAQLAELADALAVEGVSLVDVGGDVIAHGDEITLLSPLADALTLAALDGLSVPTEVVVAGPGLDGEIPAADVMEQCVRLANRSSTLQPASIPPYLTALAQHPSEATTLLAAAATGVRGRAEIRDNAAAVPLDQNSATIHTLTTAAALAENGVASQMVDSHSQDEAEAITVRVAGRSELGHERRKAERMNEARPPEPAWNEVQHRYADYRGEAADRGITLVSFRRLSEVVGFHGYQPARIRDLIGDDAHDTLSLCQLTRTEAAIPTVVTHAG